MTKAALLLLCVLIVPLSGCQECGRSLSIRVADFPPENPLSIDPAHVQEHAPNLYLLLEKALVEGASGTDDEREVDAAFAYFQKYHNQTYPALEYRGTFLRVSLFVC